MKAFYTDHFVLPLPSGHRFPMEKYSRLHDLVATVPEVELLEAPSATDTQILYAHDPSYLIKVLKGNLSTIEQREIGFPWSEKMVERSRRSSGATVAAAKIAFKEGIAANLAGGTHHAYRDQGSGFCVFNDSAIAARTLQKEINPKLQIAVIDLDDQTYLNALEDSLEKLKSRFSVDFVIYLAGADPYEHDRLGRLKLSKNGIQKRDEIVFQYAMGNQIPLALSMAGGYGKHIETTVDIHFQTIKSALKFQLQY